MKSRYRFLRKSYAMQRMAQAIERAIEGTTSKEKERAARWAAAWGLLCGIKTPTVRLRRGEVEEVVEQRTRRSSDQIDIPPGVMHAATEAPAEHDAAPATVLAADNPAAPV